MSKKEKKLSDQELRLVVEDLEKRFSEPRGMWDRCGWRRQHYHNLPEADPILSPPYDVAPKYQWDGLRRVHTQMRARLTQNHMTVTVKPPRDTPTWRSKADDLEQVLNAGILFAEERQRLSLQGGIADGQGRYGYAVLFAFKRDVPALAEDDYETSVEMPTDEAEAKRYHYDDEAELYRETEDARLERHKAAVARAGFPWMFEFVPASCFAFDEDRTIENGVRRALIRREVALIEYDERRLKGEPTRLMFEERSAPPEDSPSGGSWGERVILYQLWTRCRFYEILAGTGNRTGEWKVVNQGEHGYDQVPCAIIPANVLEDEDDPALKYEPYLEGLYRLKPDYDRYMTLLNVMVEQSALPLYYLQHKDSGEFLLDDTGNKVTFSRNAAIAEEIPAGYELKKVEFDVSPSMVSLGEVKRADLSEATPNTGMADVTATTDPWAIRLQQAQASIEPSMYMQNAALGLQTIVRMMARVMSKPAEDGGFGETIWVFKRDTQGQEMRDSVIGVDPKDIVSLDINVGIDNTSAAERITKVEHGRQLLADPLVPLTRAKFVEEYMGLPNPDEVIAAYDAEQQYYQYIKPGWEQMKLAQWFGAKFVLGPNGSIVGFGGQEVAPGQALEANGYRPIMAPAPTPPMGGGMAPGTAGPPGAVMQGARALPPTMPNLSPLQTPGTVPLPGVVG